jgi:hypothetical protein
VRSEILTFLRVKKCKFGQTRCMSGPAFFCRGLLTSNSCLNEYFGSGDRSLEGERSKKCIEKRRVTFWFFDFF